MLYYTQSLKFIYGRTSMSNPYREGIYLHLYTEYHARGLAEAFGVAGYHRFLHRAGSTKFHCACESGLVMHSLNVHKAMRERWFDEGDSEESFICAAARRVQIAVL